MSSKADFLKDIPIGGTFGSTDTTSGAYLEGAECEIEARYFSNNPANDYGVHAGARITLKAVRNVSGIALLPGRIVHFKTSSGVFGCQVDGMPTIAGAFAGVIDPNLPAAGCPNNDICWVVVHGPCLVKTALDANETNVFSGGSLLVAITAATSQATTAGRVCPIDLSGATALLADQIINRVGRAISAATTAETNTNKLVYVRSW